MTLSDKEWTKVLELLRANQTTKPPSPGGHTNHFWSDHYHHATPPPPLGLRFWLWLLAIGLGTFLGLTFAYHG